MNVPQRHHYIPRFLIRPFCDKNGKLNYLDKSTGEISEKTPEEVFMQRNLYRDTINNPENPVQIENDLSVFENEAARIIRRLSEEDEIILSCEEEERLRIFLATMSFRSIGAQKSIMQECEPGEVDYFSFFQEDGNLTDFWKRNLGALVKCRSIDEVVKNKRIDPPIKLFMQRDLMGVTLGGTYLMLIESKGNEDFILSDCYPLVIDGDGLGGVKIQEYQIFPISPKRAIMLVARGVEYASKDATGFNNGFFKEPIMSDDGKSLTIHVH